MKAKICMLTLLFLLMAAIPLVLAVNSAKNEPSAPQSTTDENAAISAAAALCGESCGEEAIKAAVILVKTNLSAGEIVKASDNNSDKELIERVAAVYHSNKEILTYRGKAVPIPFSECSNGFTEKGEAEYIKAVASPWDCFNKEYRADLICRGVSISGIKTLCGMGLSAEEALKWYLPELSIG